MSKIPGNKQRLVEAYKAALSQWPPGDFFGPDHTKDDLKAIERMVDVVRSYDPNDIIANCIKASILMEHYRGGNFEQTKFAEAAKLLRPIIKAGTDNKSLIADFADSLYHAGEYEEAIPHLRRLKTELTNDNYNATMLCYALFKTGHKAEAIQLFKPLIEEFDDLMPYFKDEIIEMVKAGHQFIAKQMPAPGN